jgi:hypothetical protein
MSLQRSALWAVALAAVAITLPTPAQADEGTPLLDDALASYYALAQAHWGGPLPSCVENGVTVVPVHAFLYDDPDPSVAARADQPGCELWLDRQYWRTMRPVEACTIVLHEWGHMLGHGHVHDPLDLMAEFPTHPPPECAALRRGRGTARASSRRARPCASARKARRHGASARKRHSVHRPRRARRMKLACIRRTGRRL